MTLLSTRGRRRIRAVPSGVTPGATLVRVSGGYFPGVVYAKAGRPIEIVFLREETAACSERVLVPSFGKSTMLPAGHTVVVDLRPARRARTSSRARWVFFAAALW